ncbi:MAG: glycosyltransferase [Ginsengibacter sp.]
MSKHLPEIPLISVIIPCYNHGHYLQDAFDSLYSQDYPSLEIVVVDDGSTDNTKAATEKNKSVKYIYQTNKGLSAARNTGIKNSQGDLLIFLDADDWLLPNAIDTNLKFLKDHPESSFVSGGYRLVFADAKTNTDTAYKVDTDHYLHFLESNYIGMHAAVIYQRWVFDEFKFDENLRSCEDYDLYLKISRKYPVFHHTQIIAAYRMHDSNMSSNIPMMLKGVLKVLGNQQINLTTPQQKVSYKIGVYNWKKYYCEELYEKLHETKRSASTAELLILTQYYPFLATKYLIKRNYAMIKNILRKVRSQESKSFISRPGVNNLLPAQGSINAGDFNRLTPFSTEFGYDRGGPIDRYYIENFLKGSQGLIKGRVLEIGDNEYTLLFGGSQVTTSDILHVDESNKSATFIGDISNAPQIPGDIFDAIILTQTLHLIYNFKDALNTCYRILKPGGALLLTVPGITPIDHDEWKETWYWSFTDKALKKLMPEAFPGGNCEINSFGNVLIATAFLYGLGLPEIDKAKLDFNDPHFQVIVTAIATKAIR